ncbi:xanthine dehydrogenase accessory protein XdhC [Pseudooceanicola sp.]|uniref:xanthine dehydrogenase accessory protein XdhC n=1 Tax=Pseudooceanicola sp. TaxID=1914328 RepID=UPI0026043856|nr:xanthine dehydrogenase accessory protein XdhC [Pseudooceanicola sp.]MDF1854711.1 xanthine dehydrogenase accessory protein XdhC [Pseudooceanicola sp.]
MAIELEQLRRIVAAEGRVVRVVVAAVRGSAPREVGAAMIVGPGGASGTIGGGALEYEAIGRAQELDGPMTIWSALGPDLGQCCGGSVALVYEPIDAATLAALPEGAYARPVAAEPGDMPLGIRRRMAAARGSGADVETLLEGGWLLESVAPPRRALWIWGAGHVGRALVAVMAPLPGLAITWIDTTPERFPEDIPAGVETIPAADPAVLAAHAPPDAAHLVLTYAHALDLAICDALLRRGFGWAGLIGSKTKWARFRKRLTAAGHADAHISRIQCPIGDKRLGKHPQAIAVGVAAALLMNVAQQDIRKDRTA